MKTLAGRPWHLRGALKLFTRAGSPQNRRSGTSTWQWQHTRKRSTKMWRVTHLASKGPAERSSSGGRPRQG
eukprot:5692715-Amphidinium_carterae.2